MERPRSPKIIDTEEAPRVKLSAVGKVRRCALDVFLNSPALQRDLLATLSGRRISVSEIKFAANNSKAGGTFADVAVATLVRSNGDEETTVAVKKFRFIISGDTTEEKFLRVGARVCL